MHGDGGGLGGGGAAGGGVAAMVHCCVAAPVHGWNTTFPPASVPMQKFVLYCITIGPPIDHRRLVLAVDAPLPKTREPQLQSVAFVVNPLPHLKK